MPRGRVTRECDTMLASAFADPDGDEHGAAYWQVALSCDDFESPVLESHRAHENWYDGVDTQAGDDLTDEPLEGLEDGIYYCWRVRYRDRALEWSPWSEPLAFTYDALGAGAADACSDPTPLEPPAPDAGVPDAGMTPVVTSSGCGCRAASRVQTNGVWLLALLSIVWRLGRPARRRQRPRRSRAQRP